jgi:hypothetical protein
MFQNNTRKEPSQIHFPSHCNKSTISNTHWETWGKYLFTFLLLLFFRPLTAQDDRIYSAFDLSKPAGFYGGPAEWYKYLRNNITYPADAQAIRPVSRTILSFVVETDGSFSNVRVVQPINEDFRAMFLAFVQNMPKWYPAEANGHPVRQHVWLYFYIHAHARKVFFIGEGSLEYLGSIASMYALPDAELYKTVPAMEALRLPQDFPPLRVPDAAKHEKVNVEALVSYKISADGLLQDTKVLYDPGYGCGAAAKEYIENQKYWAPRCLYDTCYVDEKRAVISFVTDTVALLQSEKIWEPSQLLAYALRDTVRLDYSPVLPGTLKSGWISYSYIHEKDGRNTNLEIESTSDSMLLVNAFSSAQWLLNNRRSGPTATYCGFPCRTYEKRVMYCSAADGMKAIFNFQPVGYIYLNRSKVYALEEVDSPPTHPFGKYWLDNITNLRWKYVYEAPEKDLEGTVLLQVRVEESGRGFSKVVHDIGDGYGEFAMQLLGDKTWIPAKKNGWPVTTEFVVPVVFRRNK